MLVHIKCTSFYNSIKFRNRGEDGKVLTRLTSSPWLLSSIILACLPQLVKHTLFRFLQGYLVFFLYFMSHIVLCLVIISSRMAFGYDRFTEFPCFQGLRKIREIFEKHLAYPSTGIVCCFMTRLGLWVWGREILETENTILIRSWGYKLPTCLPWQCWLWHPG